MLDVGSLVQDVDQRLAVHHEGALRGSHGRVLALVQVEVQRGLGRVPAAGVQLDHLHVGGEQPVKGFKCIFSSCECMN